MTYTYKADPLVFQVSIVRFTEQQKVKVCRFPSALFVQCVLFKGIFWWLLYLSCPANVYNCHLRDITHSCLILCCGLMV